MRNNRKITDRFDYEKINEGVNVGVIMLKILLVLLIIVSIYILTLLFSKWHVLGIIKDLFKVISPLFIGVVIAWLLNPLVNKLEKKNVNRVLAVTFIYVVMISVIVVFGKLTFPSIGRQLNDIVSSTPNFINYLKDCSDGMFDRIASISGSNMNVAKLQVYNLINAFGVGITTNIPSLVVGILSSLLKGSLNLIFGFIIGFYMLFDFKNTRKHFMDLIPRKYKNDVSELLDELNNNLKSFVNGTLLIMMILFICQSIGLSIAGMKAPLVFGLFCAITNIIPYVGPYIGGIPTVLVGFSISPVTGIMSLVSVLICQGVESYFLQPVVMGKTMKLNPVTIMIGLLLFGHFFGIIGMIFATPIISIIKTIFMFYDRKYNLIGMITSE